MQNTDYTMLILNVALSIIGGLLGVLILILGWLGNKIYTKVEAMAIGIQRMVDELHTRITDHETRIAKIETVEELCPVNKNRRKEDIKE